MQKKNLIIVSALLVVVFSGFLVLGGIVNERVKINAPASNSNFTNLSLGQALFNVSFINASDITGVSAADFNVTFLMNNTNFANGSINETGKWFPIATLTRGCVQVGTTTTISCVANSTNVSIVIPEGTYALNANITNATGDAIMANYSNISTSIKIDRTSPVATTSNFSSNFYAGANLSTGRGGIYTINLSISDLVVGVNTVLVNFTNRSTGVSNATLTLTRDGSSNYFTTTINTSHFIDGSYNLTIIATDLLNNLNNSAVLENIILDSTAPTVSFSCSPASVEKDDVVTCSCSASDTIAGINSSYGSSGVLFIASPSTAQTGPSFSVSCTSQDTAGNIGIASTTYAVTSSGGSSSGSGSSSGGPSLSPSTSSGSSTTGPSTESETGSADASAGTGTQEAAKGATNDTPETTSNAWIFWIIGLIVIVIVIAIIMNRRK